MLKKDHCWRCDTHPSKIYCSKCELACYCSDECKRNDEFRHQVDCQTAALKKLCAGCEKENTGLKACGSCRQEWYCDTECQKKSWPTHKAHCQETTRKLQQLSTHLKFAYDLNKSTPGLAAVYYWGNTPAVDLINLSLNEGCDYSKPLSVLACGVGDPRNVVLSLSQLPEAYQEKLTFVLNDICACAMARTVLILYMLMKGGKQVASSVTQIWYSLWLSEEDYQLVICMLQELIEAPSLEELTGGAMNMDRGQLQRLAEVWRTWLDLSSRRQNWISKTRQTKIESDSVAQEGFNLYLEGIPKQHKKSAADWITNGILLPKENRKNLPRENFTLTGVDHRNKGAFTYIPAAYAVPFTSWDYSTVKRQYQSASILKMYSEYVSHVLTKCALKLATGQVKFYFLLCNCMEMAPFLPPDRKYDRVTTSNIADYVPLTSILDTCKPLLNTVNNFSVIVTEFQNWANRSGLSVKQIFQILQMPLSFRLKVREDTENPAIAYSPGRVSFVDYHDNSAEFTQFVRAALLVCEIQGGRNRRRIWKSVDDYNGLIARDFLRCQNRVFPAKWMLNSRRVTMLNGFERAVEWIVKSQ